MALDYRAVVDALTDRALADLREIFDRNSDPDSIRDDLLANLPALVDRYGSAVAAVAADWYDDLRDEAGIVDLYFAEPAEAPDTERTEILARWGVGPLYEDGDVETAYSVTAGGAQRIIEDTGRQTVTRSSSRDPHSDGWIRSTSGGGCDYCQGLAGAHTGPEFTSHDRCRCIAVPAFR